MLTWISIHYFSRAGPAASVRIYYEAGKHIFTPESTSIPQGHSYFPKELSRLPKQCVVCRSLFHPAILTFIYVAGGRWYQVPNLVFESDHEHGGHFAAHEMPEALVGDLRNMFKKGGPAFGVVKGQTGYS